jgi:hypothetical protein
MWVRTSNVISGWSRTQADLVGLDDVGLGGLCLKWSQDYVTRAATKRPSPSRRASLATRYGGSRERRGRGGDRGRRGDAAEGGTADRASGEAKPALELGEDHSGVLWARVCGEPWCVPLTPEQFDTCSSCSTPSGRRYRCGG